MFSHVYHISKDQTYNIRLQFKIQHRKYTMLTKVFFFYLQLLPSLSSILSSPIFSTSSIFHHPLASMWHPPDLISLFTVTAFTVAREPFYRNRECFLPVVSCQHFCGIRDELCNGGYLSSRDIKK